MQWLARHGWVADPNTGTATKTPGSGQAGSTGSLESNPFETLADANGVLTDSGFGELLLGAVTEIGHWDPKSVYIEAIPPSMVTVATNYIKRVTENSGPFGTDPEKLIKQFIHRMIGPYVGGGSTPSNSDSGTPSSGTANIDNAPQALLNFPRKEVYTQSELVQLYTAAEFPDPHYAAATSWCESSGNTKADSNCSTHGACVPTPVITAKDGRTVFPCCHGLWQLFLGNSPVDNGVFSATTEGLANAEDPIISTYYVSEYIKRTGDFSPWDCVSLGFIG